MNQEYDALLVASGRKFLLKGNEGMSLSQKNSICVDGIEAHQKISKILPKIKSLVLINLNHDSLNVANTIRKEFPQIGITIIDKNDNLESLTREVGEEVAKGIIAEHKKNGVKFILGNLPLFVYGEEEEKKRLMFHKGEELETDLILAFPEIFKGTKVVPLVFIKGIP